MHLERVGRALLTKGSAAGTAGMAGLFTHVDADGNGLLSEAEFGAMLQWLGLTDLTPAECKKVWAAALQKGGAACARAFRGVLV